MRTVIVGRASNLSERLAARLRDVDLLSVRELLATPDLARVLPDGEFRLVLNGFQPASSLGDLSDPVAYVERSLGLTARLLAATADTGCTKVVYTSSASVYGDSAAAAEDDRPRAGDLHAALKVANEQLVRRVCGEQQREATVVRIFNMYGGGDRSSVLAKLLLAATTGTVLSLSNEGRAVRDFIHVDDVVTSYLAVLAAPTFPVVNVATGQGTSIAEAVRLVRSRGFVVRTTSAEREEIAVSTADVSRLRTLVDVDGFVGLGDGLGAEIDRAVGSTSSGKSV